MDFATGKHRGELTSVYCVIRSMTHAVDWGQVLHRIHMSEVVNFYLTDRQGDSPVLVSQA